MTTINWKIDGMSCSTCALTVRKYLEKEGFGDVKVNLAGGDVIFTSDGGLDAVKVQKGIKDLGYSVRQDLPAGTAGTPKKQLNKHLRQLYYCLPFTLLLMLPMLFGGMTGGHGEALGNMAGHQGDMNDMSGMATGQSGGIAAILMNPWTQLILCLPVYLIGMSFFGRSAIKSIANGLPNMNVLIAAGASAAFLYSLAGTLLHLGPDYQFYETAASIITIVFLGYYIEDASIRSTQKALDGLVRTQKLEANMIAFDDQHQEILFPVDAAQLRSGDLILIRSGEQVPADCKILWGEAGADEAIITGESLPVEKKAKDFLVGGSILVSGSVKAQVTAAANESVLAGIVRMVQQAQGEKAPVQQLADKISAIFVPVVLVLALLTLGINYAVLHSFSPALMRCIAVLVIACPCAMGLATPAAIAVGLGRAARRGILFRNAKSLESFRNIRRVVFDKTGTLTTGEFTIADWGMNKAAASSSLSSLRSTQQNNPDAPQGAVQEELHPEWFQQLVFSLEKYSNHPIAKSITREWKPAAGNAGATFRWKKIEEIKGLGMRAETATGDIYLAGSYKVAAGLTQDNNHNVYIVRNQELLGWVDVKDQVRSEAAAVINSLHKKGIRTVLLSGDRAAACQTLAGELGIDEVYAEQTPADKLDVITRLSMEEPTAMIGDGINDAPALAKATVGISLSDASQLAMQTADVVLMNHGLRLLPEALLLGKHTYNTIRQNLFWAFFYNIFAIPVAAVGLLVPALAALAMGFSDVVLAGNSLRLFARKLS